MSTFMYVSKIVLRYIACDVWSYLCILMLHIYSFPIDFISNVKLDNMLCRVGHVCATCFIEYYWAFRLLWLHCFKPHEHQFSGQVIAVYDSAKRTLCRVRKPTGCVMQKCSVSNCINGRKCNKAHSSIELEFWNLQKSIQTN